MSWDYGTCTAPAGFGRTTGRRTRTCPIRRRERQQQLFKSQASAQRFLTTPAAVYNTFYTQRHLTSRRTLRLFRAQAHAAWAAAAA
jgi:putative transposase